MRLMAFWPARWGWLGGRRVIKKESEGVLESGR